MNLNNTHTPGPTLQAPEHSSKKPCRILLLHPVVAHQDLANMVGSLGFVAVPVAITTVSDGLRVLRERNYDAILISPALPEQETLRLLEQLKFNSITCAVIVVLAQNNEQLAINTIRAGATDFLIQDQLAPARLYHTLTNAIRLHHSEKKRHFAEENFNALQYQLEFVIKNSPLSAWSCDSNGIITYMEGDVFSDLGIDSGSAIGSYYADVFKMYPAIVSRFDKAMAGEPVESVAETKGIYFKACYVPVRDKSGKMAGITGFAYDVTDQVLYEEKLTRAKELAEEALRVKEQFLANISHEIRTPMNGIMGLSKVLQKTPLNHEQQRYLNAIQQSSKNLMQILNDLLDVAKITANKIVFEHIPFNLPELIQETLDLLEVEATLRGNTLLTSLPAQVPARLVGDSLRLRQILLNLVGNAIKFTTKGTIRLSASVISKTETEAWLAFKVEDTGIGISPDNLKAIFESFNQGSNDTTRKYGGTGLGLTITKSLVEMQGGRITVDSTPGKGSVFTFTLPFKINTLMDNQQKADNLNDQPQEPPFGKMRILLAEDNEINQLLVNTVLEEWGCTTDTVANGKEALAKLKINKYDLVLMDMQMPEMDGYEAIIKIRQSGAHYAKIPIIALTAHATTSEVEKCLSTGADGYLSKPFEPEELHQNIVRLTTEYRAHSK